MKMAVEQGDEVGGGDKVPPQTAAAASPPFHSYPPPLTTYEDIVCSRDLFLDSLKKLHISMGTKFMIPIIGGRDLDLHRLFVEVTCRGGITKILNERKWKEVTAVFSFPSSATNASFILRKYYISLLYHFEQIYFFKAKAYSPSPIDAMQTLSAYVPLLSHPPSAHHKPKAESSTPQVSLEPPSSGAPVSGVIDGKFESGYLITVKIGMEEFRGVLYQVPNHETQFFQDTNINQPLLKPGGAPRRKRRKKSEIRKRDPAHPKPNRSGYNFFFAEQHARLKPHYHGKDREISRIIGESWNKLQEPERSVYQEKAMKDKERYKMEMEVYRERLRTGQIATSTVPAQHATPIPSLADLNCSVPLEGTHIEDNEALSSDKSEFESGDKDSDFGECSQADMELKNVNIEVMADEAFDVQKKSDGGCGDDEAIGGEDGIAVHVEEAVRNGNESVAVDL